MSEALSSATDRVREEWRARIAAEYTSAAITQNLVLWLIQAGAPPDLIEAGLAIVSDELAHSELSHEVYAEAGGTAPPAIVRDNLGLARTNASLELDILSVAVRVFCLGETVAVPLFKHLRERCTEPVARTALDRILRDEVRHRDFGWDLLDWLCASPISDSVVPRLTDQLPGMFAELEASYGAGNPVVASDDGGMTDAERAWGLAPPREYAEILASTVEKDYRPRFAARGIMIALLAALVLAACNTDVRAPAPDDGSRALSFGPLSIDAHTEDLGACVALTLHNDDDLFVNEVELTTGPGFHHSNWLWVPDYQYPGPDGVFRCDDRSYDQTAAGILGGVFFAQSTQAEHEIQAFPPGVALKLPPQSKLVAQLHLLNNNDETLDLEPEIAFKTIPAHDVTTKLASVTFEYHPLALPPQRQSRVRVECDLEPRHSEVFGTPPNFNIYYALAHYHGWGTGMMLEAVKPDGTAATIYSTKNNVGDALGGAIDPTFSMVGYTKLRLTCEYFNNTDRTLYYGNGLGEMCIFNAFSDSPYNWAGGALSTDSSGAGTDDHGVMTFSRPCQVFGVESEKF